MSPGAVDWRMNTATCVSRTILLFGEQNDCVPSSSLTLSPIVTLVSWLE